MKITLLKNYLNHSAGEAIEVSEERGKYLCRIKSATTDEAKTVIKKRKHKK